MIGHEPPADPQLGISRCVHRPVFDCSTNRHEGIMEQHVKCLFCKRLVVRRSRLQPYSHSSFFICVVAWKLLGGVVLALDHAARNLGWWRIVLFRKAG